MSFSISCDDFFLLRRARKSKKVKATATGQRATASSSSIYENQIDEASRTFRSSASLDGEVLARLSMFKNLIPCSMEGNVKESYAIVKRSKDPYEDFKGSMVEMILEKQMFEKQDLEDLFLFGRLERSTSKKKSTQA